MKVSKLLLGLLLSCAGWIANAQIVIKFSHVVAVDTPKGKAAEYFAKKAAELTRGNVKVEVYANSSLYKDKEEIEALQIGAVQMLAPSLSKFGPLGVKEFEAFDLPFLFDSTVDLHKITQGPVGAGLMARLEPKGIKGLAFWDNGFKSFTANTPLKTPADFKGKKGKANRIDHSPEPSRKRLQDQNFEHIRSSGQQPERIQKSRWIFFCIQNGMRPIKVRPQ